MPEFDKTNTVSVNKADASRYAQNPPELELDLNIDGVRYFAKAWAKKGPNGTFYSGPIERADDKYQPGGVPAGVGASDDDSIPF